MDQIKKLFSSLSLTQALSIAICALAVGGGILWFSRFERESGMRPLYTSLSPEDASAMVQKLREEGVDYRISENGTSVLVPEQRVPELRLEMAGLGLPKTGRIGFEIFDKTNFGITDFAEHVNYRRAVEGELERSIMAIAEVQQARVHVTLPKDSVFTDAREPAKASVLVGLRAGMRLSQQNVAAITNLVSSAVEGLSPESISVVDMHGNLLSRARKDQLADGAQNTEAALDYRQALEHDLVMKINNTLEPLLGADKFRTGVSAEVDMASGEQSEETFDPTRSVMVSSQKTEETSGTTRIGSVAPGTAANLPPQTSAQPATPAPTAPPGQTQPAQAQPPAGQTQTAQQQAASRPAGNTNSTVRRTESINYQSSRTTKHVKLPQGTVKRLSIAVLVDQGSKWEGQGKDLHRVVTPPEPEKLKAIQALVSTLVGLDMQRGDQLTVEALPFDNTLSAEPMSVRAPESAKKPDEVFSLETLRNKPALLWGSVGGAVLLIALAVFAMTRGGKRRVRFETREVLPESPSTAGALTPTVAGSGAMNLGDAHQLPALMPSRTEVLLNQLQETGKNNPEVWAGILRGWLTEEEAN